MYRFGFQRVNIAPLLSFASQNDYTIVRKPAELQFNDFRLILLLMTHINFGWEMKWIHENDRYRQPYWSQLHSFPTSAFLHGCILDIQEINAQKPTTHRQGCLKTLWIPKIFQQSLAKRINACCTKYNYLESNSEFRIQESVIHNPTTKLRSRNTISKRTQLSFR